MYILFCDTQLFDGLERWCLAPLLLVPIRAISREGTTMVPSDSSFSHKYTTITSFNHIALRKWAPDASRGRPQNSSPRVPRNGQSTPNLMSAMNVGAIVCRFHVWPLSTDDALKKEKTFFLFFFLFSSFFVVRLSHQWGVRQLKVPSESMPIYSGSSIPR